MFKRLIDWWTRPSWEEYDAEQKYREDAMDRAVGLLLEKSDLIDRLNFNATANANLLVNLVEAKQIIKELIEETSFDHSGWHECGKHTDLVEVCKRRKDLLGRAHEMIKPKKVMAS